MGPVELKIERQKEIFLLTASGELVAGEGDERIRQELDRVHESGNTRVILDLSDVSYLDSSVLGQLIHGHSVLGKAGGGLRLVNPSQRVTDLLKLTQLITIFEIYPSREEALAGWLQQ